MKLEKKQRFSIRKYAVGAASVLIGFAFSAQVVSADGITPAPTAEETVQTIQESPQAVKETVDSKVPEKLEEKADEPVKEEVKEDQETPRTVAPNRRVKRTSCDRKCCSNSYCRERKPCSS